MTEKLLYQDFDLQRFMPNVRLQNVVNASHARTTKARELSDDELEYVSAAGTLEMKTKKPEVFR